MPLFDTDVLIDVLRGVKGAKDFVIKNSGPFNLISAITYGEILFGMRQHEQEETRSFLSAFKAVDVDSFIVDAALEVKTRAKGHSLELYDCIIAATAIKTNMALVTRNKKHYPDKRLKIISPGY